MNCEGAYLITSIDGDHVVTATRTKFSRSLYEVRGLDGCDFGTYDTLAICQSLVRGNWLIHIETAPQTV